MFDQGQRLFMSGTFLYAKLETHILIVFVIYLYLSRCALSLLSSSNYFYDKVVSLADVSLFYLLDVSLFYLLAVCFLYLFSLLIKDIFCQCNSDSSKCESPKVVRTEMSGRNGSKHVKRKSWLNLLKSMFS